ncbi:unnamed protein product [Thelazia callipaeda]|uniref:Lipase_3 domain-containing protein n=1 Tax=Thelazia callipaeda TaxID=103827 RepID=A0A0N5D2U5_THECL|nr:unnamed protein product [Thelazia callipaeda]
MQILEIVFTIIIAFWGIIDAASVNVCNDAKTCAECAESYIYVFGFREHCRWCVETATCVGPFACATGSGIVQREPFMCPQPVPTAKGHRYTDRLGRSLYSLALAVRESDPTECLANSRPDVKLIKRYEVECDQSHNLCASMLAVSVPAKSIYVVYKSSNMDKQLITELIHTVAAQLGAWQKFESGGGVMTYFHGAFERLFKGTGMKEQLIELNRKYPHYKVWVTGHSLGASLASMTALYLANHSIIPRDLIRLVTFGEARTGNVAFARAVERNIRFRYRVVHRGDLVTNIPANIDSNGILVTRAVAERQPHFYRFLVYYDNDMKPGSSFKKCNLSEDYACRNLPFTNNALDHLNYFGVNVDEYLAKKCKGNLLKLNTTIAQSNSTSPTLTTTNSTVTTNSSSTSSTTTTSATTISLEENSLN